MRTAIATVLLLAACSPSPQVGFYDLSRVLGESTAAKELFADADRAAAPRRTQAQEAIDRFHADEKAPLSAGELQRRRDDTQGIVNTVNAEAKKAREDVAVRLGARAGAIAGRLGVARQMRLVIVLPGKPPYGDPGSDLTSDVIAELDGLTPDQARARAMAAAATEPTRIVQK